MCPHHLGACGEARGTILEELPAWIQMWTGQESKEGGDGRLGVAVTRGESTMCSCSNLRGSTSRRKRVPPTDTSPGQGLPLVQTQPRSPQPAAQAARQLS